MLPAVTPMPPLADCVLPWDGPVSDTVATVSRARLESGDTFLVDSGEDRYLFLFSDPGLRAFYAVPEEQASKGIADWKMLRRKLPDELFDGRRTLPHELFGRVAVAGYLDALEEAIALQLSELDPPCEIEVFGFSRLLGHRLGLASWAGREILHSPRLHELIAALDLLDGSEAFVRPARMQSVALSNKETEREAMAQAEEILIETISARATPGDDLLGTIIERWGDMTVAENARGAARDVILVHIGSMSNMFAALGWSLVHLLEEPQVLTRLRPEAGQEFDTDLASRCVLESIRIAQRSIMLRTVLEPVVIDDGAAVYSVSAGATLATFLPLTNLAGAPGLDRYDPERWQGRKFVSPEGLADEAITTFGHGPHACPARPFSTTAIVRVLERLFRAFDLERRFVDARPLAGQIGGVARADGPCNVVVTPRSDTDSVA